MIESAVTYLYVDLDFRQYYIQGAEVTDRGNWDSMAIYQRAEAVVYQDGLYFCLTPNSGAAPTGFVDENWSALVIITGAGSVVSSAGSDYWARLAAAQAMATAQIGTTAAYAAGALAGDSYFLAQTGTEVAWLALQIAIEGTNTGTAALELAAAGTSAAQFAISIAGVGTDAAAYAIQLASAGTSAANFAIELAGAGTSAGQFAIALASTGTDFARFAADVAVAGTQAAQNAQAQADFAVTVAGYGTDAAYAAGAAAGQAYSLAMLGTVPPPLYTLPDVSIPTPTAQQVLTFDGSVWVASDAPSTTSPQALTAYPEDVASGTAGYSTLSPVPLGVPENLDSVNITALNTPVYIEGYISNQINRVSIDAGVWEFNTYGAITTAGRDAYIATDVYKRDIAGNEVYLFSGTTGPYTVTTPVLLADIVVAGSYACSLTDKLVAKYWALRKSNPAAVTVEFYHSGTDHASHIHTPLGVSHNDLRGLQGGTTDQYYHVTVDQNNALAGSFGYPNGTNTYVTTTDPRLFTAQQQADLAVQIASIGTNTGTAAYNLALLAYNLSSAPFPDVGNRLISGGNAVWVSGYDFMVEPTTVSFDGSEVSYPTTLVQLDASDGTNNRLDLIVADSTGTIIRLTGTPSSPPAPPDYDPASQFQLTFIPVDANTTEYQYVSRTWAYREHIEWTYADNTGNINPDSLTDPYQGAKAIEGTNVVNGNYFQLTAPTQFSLANFDTLFLYIKPKAVWGTRYLRFHWQSTSGGARVGQYFSLNEGALGFQTSNNSYQLVAIPLKLFGVPTATLVQTLRVQAVATGSFGFFIDDIGIQVGVSQPTNIPAVTDATTTSKGIVELAENGEAGSNVVVQGNDYRLALATTGTNLIIVEQGTRSQADATEVYARGTADAALSDRIDALNRIMGLGWSGTSSFYVGRVPRGPADTQTTQANGVVIYLGTQPYGWEDFETYSVGSRSTFDNAFSAFSAPGAVIVNTTNGTGFRGWDTQIGTANGTNFSGTITVLTAGTNWGGDGIAGGQNFYSINGSETFETYVVGTVYGTGTLNGASGFGGAAIIVSH